MTEPGKRASEFIVYTGPMFSGKSSSLLAAIDRYRHQGRVVDVFKPCIDDRYSAVEIVTHGGWRIEAKPVASGLELMSSLLDGQHEPDVVAVDELFMIPGAATALVELFREGISVVVSSLDLSATGSVFSEVRDVLPWATRIEKLTAVCAVCKSDARYTWRKGTMLGSKEIEVGGAESYEPRCHGCHQLICTSTEESES